MNVLDKLKKLPRGTNSRIFKKSGVLLMELLKWLYKETADYAMEDVRQIFKQRDIQSRMIEQQKEKHLLYQVFLVDWVKVYILVIILINKYLARIQVKTHKM